EIPGRLLCRDLDLSVDRHQPFRQFELLDHLDASGARRLVLDIRHRHPAVDAGDAEPMEDIGHQLLEAHVLDAGDALGTAEISVGGVTAGLALARVVDEEFGDLAEGPALLAVVDDDPDPALLRRLCANLDAMHEIGPARADVGAKDVRAIAFVVDAAGDDRLLAADRADIAE